MLQFNFFRCLGLLAVSLCSTLPVSINILCDDQMVDLAGRSPSIFASQALLGLNIFLQAQKHTGLFPVQCLFLYFISATFAATFKILFHQQVNIDFKSDGFKKYFSLL